jgi:hypothetical protein
MSTQALRDLIVAAAGGAQALRATASAMAGAMPATSDEVRKQADELQRAVMRAMHAVRIHDKESRNASPT